MTPGMHKEREKSWRNFKYKRPDRYRIEGLSSKHILNIVYNILLAYASVSRYCGSLVLAFLLDFRVFLVTH